MATWCHCCQPPHAVQYGAGLGVARRPASFLGNLLKCKSESLAADLVNQSQGVQPMNLFLVTQACCVCSYPSPVDTHTLQCGRPHSSQVTVGTTTPHVLTPCTPAAPHPVLPAGPARLPEGPLQQCAGRPAPRAAAAAGVQAGFPAAPGPGPLLPAQHVSTCPCPSHTPSEVGIPGPAHPLTPAGCLRRG